MELTRAVSTVVISISCRLFFPEFFGLPFEFMKSCVAKIRENTLMFQMDMVDLTLILLGHQLECMGPSF